MHGMILTIKAGEFWSIHILILPNSNHSHTIMSQANVASSAVPAADDGSGSHSIAQGEKHWSDKNK